MIFFGLIGNWKLFFFFFLPNYGTIWFSEIDLWFQLSVAPFISTDDREKGWDMNEEISDLSFFKVLYLFISTGDREKGWDGSQETSAGQDCPWPDR